LGKQKSPVVRSTGLYFWDMWYFFADKIHGLTAIANSYNMAWALIRAECHRTKKNVPTLAQIERVRSLTEDETRLFLRSCQQNRPAG